MDTLVQIVTHLGTFALGVLTGVSGKYLADTLTDRRRAREAERDLAEGFTETASKMPDLIREMQHDLSVPGDSLLREFFVLRSKGIAFNPGGRTYLFYYEEEHENLVEKVLLLEEAGFLREVTDTNTPRYRMSERFADFVRKAKITPEGVTL